MNCIVIPDQNQFTNFRDGLEIDATVIAPKDHLKDFKVGKINEVWYKTNVKGHEKYFGIVIHNYGFVPSKPEGEPEVLMVRIRRASAKEILQAS